MLSRVADSLYWMSRYLERAEHTARLVDVAWNLMLDETSASAGPRWVRLQACLLPAPVEGGDGGDASGRARVIAFELLHKATFASCVAVARENTRAIVACLAASRENLRQVRETVSSEMFEHLNRLHLNARRRTVEEIWTTAPHEFLEEVIAGSHLFEGVTDATMCRDEGWHFIQLGRALERATATAALLDVHFGEFRGLAELVSTPDLFLDWLGALKSCAAFEAYCRVHTAELRPERVAEFLLLEPEFPRSVRFGVDVVEQALTAIAAATGRRDGRAERLAGRLRSDLVYDQIGDVVAGGLHAYLVEVQAQCARIHQAIHEAYVEAPLETVLST
jgi:uncharacterized alpha-E superfamily protein